MSRCTRFLADLASGTVLTQIVCCGVGPVSRPSPSWASQVRPSTADQNAPSPAGSPASRHRSLNRAIAIVKNLPSGAEPTLARACGSPHLGVTACSGLETENAVHGTCYNEHTC